MSQRTVNFKPNKKTIKVGTKVYEVKNRTPKSEALIKDWDEKKRELSDLESFQILFEIMLGDEATKELLADGDDADLDYLDAILIATQELYYEEKKKAEDAEISKQMARLNPIAKGFEGAAPMLRHLKSVK